jgi:hypothetical protein
VKHPTIVVQEVPGTRVHLVKYNESNPARKVEDITLFRNGYWEVHVSSTGEHPDFLQGWWKILLVTPAKAHIEFEIDSGSGLWFVPVSPNIRPVSIKTTINYMCVGDIWLQFLSFVITLSDNAEVKVQCGDAHRVSSNAVN